MKLVDSHAHLNDEAYKEDLKEVIERVNEELAACICSSSDISSSQEAIRLAKENPKIFANVGVHPENVEDFDEEKVSALLRCDKVVAVGEIGLDYHYLKDLSPEEIDAQKLRQKEVFIRQINLANKFNLPIVVHSRDAMGDTIEILKKNPPKRASLLHCYSGSVESAKILMDMGFSFSFGGVTTFKNAKSVQEVVKSLPLERILLETDCPYLAPEPFRGTRNEPKNVKYVADKIATLKGLSIEEVAEATTKNAKRLFSI